MWSGLCSMGEANDGEGGIKVGNCRERILALAWGGDCGRVVGPF